MISTKGKPTHILKTSDACLYISFTVMYRSDYNNFIYNKVIKNTGNIHIFINRRMDKCSIYITEYYTTLRIIKLLHSTTWINPTDY